MDLDREIEAELQSFKYRGEFNGNNFQAYVACHEKILQLMNYLKADCYNDIDKGTHVHRLLAGIDERSLKLAVQVCMVKLANGIYFNSCTSYCTSMLPKIPAARK